MASSADIRQQFLKFFSARGHEQVPSGTLVPPNDPTLMFVNAGMVPFKDVFTGKETRGYRRATSSQKCIRISGKHNDLENVGVTARHHTFFEMLGNFSFGDYFKREAIEFAWEFVTKTVALDPERLVVTVFGGEEGYGPADDEAAAIWRDVSGLDAARIIRCGAKENFWQMGEVGPCGPCSEIHYCLGLDSTDPSTFGEEPAADGRGWFEIWNLVFMQFVRHEAGGSLHELPAPSVDTGAGLERMAVVGQDVFSNYDTDLLRPIVDLASEIAGRRYGGTQEAHDVSMRVIADHARTTAFLISEGIFPDKEDRAYVLRRVMRRAIRHGHQLGISEPFLHHCALKVVDLMNAVYPQLSEHRDLIRDVTEQEEERFRRTLRRGLDLLEENDAWLGDGADRVLPGDVAFKLYDTYGFPLDLQHVIGEEQGFRIDDAGFESALQEAKERSQGSKVGGPAVLDVYRQVLADVGPVSFTGYAEEDGQSEIVALIHNGVCVRELPIASGAEAGGDGLDGEVAEVVVRETPFYGERGGQAGDRGELRLGDVVFDVHDTQRPLDDLVIHRGTLRPGTARSTLRVGDEVSLRVDRAARVSTRRNHSATHLLHWALREVVGTSAVQKGSLVSSDRLRFDFSASRALSAQEIAEIEDLVNHAVLENTEITTEELPIAEAKERGAIGIFEEKYGATVRMVRIGPSLELCGGTHAYRTGDIGIFKILSDSGLAAGVRRIEACTGLRGLARFRAVDEELAKAAALLKSPPLETSQKASRALAKQRELEKEIERLNRQLIRGGKADLQARRVGDINVLASTVDVGDGKALRDMADQLKNRMTPAIVMLGSKSRDGKKALLVCSVSQELTDRYQAGAMIREAAAVVGGGGGGRADFAQAGGSDPSKLSEAVEVLYRLVQA